MRRFTMICALAIALLASSNAVADIVTFDDIAEGTIPNGYAGFNWGQFGVAEGALHGAGYANGVVSPDNVAFNEWANVAMISDGAFNFEGAYLTGAWNDGLNVNIKGYLGGAVVYDTTVVTSAYMATWFDFDYLNVDALEFTSFGGIAVPGWNGSGEHFAMDNFTVSAVPVPGAVLLGMLGLSVAGARLRKKSA
jgi:hypothetical protein